MMLRVSCNLNDFMILLWAGNNSSSGASKLGDSSTPGSSSAKEGERTQDLPPREVPGRSSGISKAETHPEGTRTLSSPGCLAAGGAAAGTQM